MGSTMMTLTIFDASCLENKSSVETINESMDVVIFHVWTFFLEKKKKIQNVWARTRTVESWKPMWKGNVVSHF